MALTPGLYIGTAGWSYKDWKDNFYPEKMPAGIHQLTYLSRFFNTVEINNSFYYIPPVKNTEIWVGKVSENPHFKFSMKLWQGFTHAAEYPEPNDIKRFRESLDIIFRESRLGAVLIQFPWSFKRNEQNSAKIQRILEDFSDYPLAVETRHKSWDDTEFLELLKHHRTAFCNIDQPVIGDSIGPSSYVTGDIAYIRFHGRNYEKWFASDDESAERYNYLYTEQELAPWVDKIKEILEKKIDTYVITNNHWHGKAAHTALLLMNKINGEKQKVPEPLKKSYPELKNISIEERDNQGDLF